MNGKLISVLFGCLPLIIAGCGSDRGSSSSGGEDSLNIVATQVDSSVNRTIHKEGQPGDTFTAKSNYVGDESEIIHDFVLTSVRNNQINEAYDYLNAKISQNKNDIWLKYDLAMTYQSAGDLQNAIAQLVDAVGIEENPLLYAKLGILYTTLGEQKLAETAFEKAARLDASYAGMSGQKLPPTDEDKTDG